MRRPARSAAFAEPHGALNRAPGSPHPPSGRYSTAGATRTAKIDEIRGEFIAIDLALDRLKPGDLCLVLVDQVEEALEHLRQRIQTP